MALSESAVEGLLGALRAGEGTDLIREIAGWVLNELIEAEAVEAIGAGRYERGEGRVTHRNGLRFWMLAAHLICAGENNEAMHLLA